MASSKPIRAKSAVVPSIRDAYGFEVKKDYLTLYHKYAPLWEKEEGERSQRWGTFLDLFGSSDEDHAGGSAQHQAALDKLEGALSIWRLTDRQARDTETPAWQQQLRSMVQAGVPMALRGRMWKIFLGLTGKKKEGVYDKLVTKALGKRQHRHQKRETGSKGPDIEKDLHRTFPGHPVMDGSGRNALRRILAAYSRRNASVGYCQGMNFVAGCLLLFMDEEDAFWCLTVIVEDLLPGYFSMAMVAPQVDQLVFKHMVDMRFPTLAQHLEDHGVNASSVSTQWFLCIFVNSLPLETCLRVWDMFFFESCASVLFRVALALVDIYSQALMATTDSVDAFSLLQNMAPMSYDSSRLIDVACIGFSSLSDTQLATLRAVYRTTVLAQFQDDVEEERWSDSEEEGAHLQPQRSSLSSPGGAALPALLPSAPGGSIDLEEGLQLVQRSQSASGPKRRRTKEVAELAGGSSLCSSPGGSGCSTPLSTSPASPWSLDSQDWHATPTWPDAHPHPPLSKLAAVLHPAADLAVPSAPADYSAALVGGEEAVEQGPSMDQAQYDAALRQTWELAARLPKIGVSAGAAKKQEGRQGLGQKVLARFHLPEMGLGDQLRTLMPGRKGSPAGLPISNAAPLKPDASRAAATLYEIASTPSPTRYAPQRLPPHTPAPSPADNARAATGPTGQADGAEAAGVLLPPATPQEHCVGSHYGAPATPENTPQAEGAAARARLGAATYVSLRAAASAATTVAEQDGLPALACHPLDLSEAGSNLSSSPRTAASSAYASPQKLVPHSLDAQLAAQGGETAPQPSLSRLRSHLAPAPGSPVLSGTSDPASASMAAVVVRSAADVEKGAGSGTVDDARAAGAKQQLLGLVEGLEEELFLAEARRHDAESQVSTLAADAAELAGRLEDARGLLEERRQTAALLDDKLRGVAGQLADTDCELAGRAAALDGARAHLALKHSLLGEKDTLIAQLNRQVAQVSGDSLGRALFRNLNLNRFRRSEKPAVPGSRRDDPASHSVTSPARHMQPS
ncbi:hypothetical protein WJX72_008307 [[Myrmecia] bisecta]|uniref:Rab-GAP TBC domain-containing protein n=1 Tax=[Myrmecia] bisecta TaxID=41462 RepID=A0AAW1PQB3_9CHLO